MTSQKFGPVEITAIIFLLLAPLYSIGATLPVHPPLSILIIADEVNPHNLSNADLTQPEDLAPALSASDSGLNIGRIRTIYSQCVDEAITALQDSELPDVVLYFAHRAAAFCNGNNAQPTLTSLIRSGLESGMGLLALHHGLYVDFTNRGAKTELLQLIGSEADSIEWNTTDGQRVFNTGADHFITSNGMSYENHANFSGAPGTTGGNYPYFTNVPDELYAVFRLHESPGEIRTSLFASDSGENRLLGYVLRKADWKGMVIAYQPGEYQPNALDDRNGRNFQILVNALYFTVNGDKQN